jgi:hypothetical protein
MIYGARHSDKCLKDELVDLKESVIAYLASNGLHYTKLVALNSFGGRVRIYTGGISERLPLRMRRRLVAYRDPETNEWIGNKNAISFAGNNGGNQVIERHNEPIKEKEYFDVFRTDWNNKDQEIMDNERKSLTEFLRK